MSGPSAAQQDFNAFSAKRRSFLADDSREASLDLQESRRSRLVVVEANSQLEAIL